MNINYRIYRFLLAAALMISTAEGRSQMLKKGKQDKPNIIYIMADDLGYGDVGFNGQQKIKTPHIDQLAREGMVFNTHYAGSAVCAPSRAALMTGTNTAHGHVRELSAWTASGKSIDLLAEEQTVAEELKRAGYTTGMIGKWGLDESNTTGKANDQGFDYFFGYKTHTEAHHYYPDYLWRNDEKVLLPNNNCEKKEGKFSNDMFTEEAVSFIEKNKKAPFFLYLPYSLPHNEITVPQDSKRPYQELDWPKRPMTPGHYHHDAEGNTAYAGMVSRLDDYVGQLLAVLKANGLDENTLVIFTSDHGPAFDRDFFNSNGPFKGHKLQLYEGGLRVPFVARWPKNIKAGSVTSHASAFWDFLPTVCEIAGIEPSLKIDGISYLPTLLGKENQQKKHASFYWEINENQGPIQAVIMGDWKGIKQFEKPFELYNLKKDIKEEENLADSNPAMVKKIKDFMIATRTESEEFPLTKRKAHYKGGNE